MVVYEKTGSFVPSALAEQLAAAGIDCPGLTCTEDDEGTVTAVQIICGDDTAEKAVDAVIAAYAPPEPPPDPPAPIHEQLAIAIASLPPDEPVTGAQLGEIFNNLQEGD